MSISTRISRSHRLPLVGLTLPLIFIGCHSSIKYPSGGYPYPEQVAAKDINHYFYPIRDKETRSDSLRDALDYYFYGRFDEPDLSTRPLPAPVFRMCYSELGTGTVIITLTPTELTVKKERVESKSGKYHYDSSELDATALKLLSILNNNYPLDRVNTKLYPAKSHYLDSMAGLFPSLYDPAHYLSLYQKSIALNPKLSGFTTLKRSVSGDEYERLVNLIDASGYWQLPYRHACPEENMEVNWLALEANTPEKYNLVEGPVCPGDTSNYYKACQELANFANLDKKIRLTGDGKPGTGHHLFNVVQDVQLEEVREAPEANNPPAPPPPRRDRKHR